jgi:predicted dehydrogenase
MEVSEMSKQYRVGIIGFGHMHVNNVAQLFATHPQVTLMACADTVPLRPEVRAAPYTRAWNQEHLVRTLGIPKSYEDYREMLACEALDIAIVTCENAQHPDVVEACAMEGTHVCVEKPMAASLPGALRMARACQAAGTTLVVNWPLTWSPGARAAKALIEDGVVGQVIEVKWRSGHNGPLGPGVGHAGVDDVAAPMSGAERGATWWHQEAAGGGAMLDYCCYGTMVSRWYIGEDATAAVGLCANLGSQWGDAEDNAVMVVRYPSAIALLEGSWTTLDHGVPTGPIIYGMTGTLVIQRGGAEESVRLERGHGDTSVYAAPALPEGRANIAEETIHCLDTGEPLHPTLKMVNNLAYMAILDAGLRSARSGRIEMVSNATWQIG